MRGFSLSQIPFETNMAPAREEKDGVAGSDWLYGCMSIQLHPEAVLTALIGTAPWK